MGVTAVGHAGRAAARGRRVVVLGAGLAGLLAAAAASGDGRRVMVLERDVLPDRPLPRDGVPQGRQPHVFLHRGLRAIEELLPGFAEQLAAAGAVALDTGDLAWLGASGWAPPGRGSSRSSRRPGRCSSSRSGGGCGRCPA
ncbi:FAD-binding protein [Georgenia sp. 10Sc9-8]|uniref:FAD-binding protein n=1 Tax=Georgenia halotolerans TaxID=3028317 RepID=A0ABT5TYG9_9MICO|nr:FAD-binding protein [Georgenia halotolerans]